MAMMSTRATSFLCSRNTSARSTSAASLRAPRSNARVQSARGALKVSAHMITLTTLDGKEHKLEVFRCDILSMHLTNREIFWNGGLLRASSSNITQVSLYTTEQHKRTSVAKTWLAKLVFIFIFIRRLVFLATYSYFFSSIPYLIYQKVVFP